MTHADAKKVEVKAQLEAQEIINDTNMNKTIISSEGTAKSKKELAEAEWYSLKKEAEAKLKASNKIADEIRVRGKAEAQLAKNLASRRKYELEMAKLGVVKELALNNSLVLFGDHKENLLAQIETFKYIESSK